MHEELQRIWRDHAAGILSDDQAQAAAQAAYGRRSCRQGKDTTEPQKPPAGRLGPPRTTRREKVFGLGRPRALDRNAKARIMHLARCLMRRTEPGRAYGQITAKAIAVLEALLWDFHNACSGLCFPSYERIAEAAGCARSTVYEAIKALEAVRLLSWVNRLKRVREWAPSLPGVGATRTRVLRTSNAYRFDDPASKSEKPSGTPNQGFIPLFATPAAAEPKGHPTGKAQKSCLSRPFEAREPNAV
jgi:Helix-turn-helix domain